MSAAISNGMQKELCCSIILKNERLDLRSKSLETPPDLHH